MTVRILLVAISTVAFTSLDSRRGHAGASMAMVPSECPVAAATATVWLLGAERGTGEIDAVEISPVVFDKRPDVRAEAWVVPYPQGEAVRMKIRGAVPAETGRGWLVRLDDARATPLRKLQAPPGRRPEAPSEVVVIWPATDVVARVGAITPSLLPPEVANGTVNVAVDTDADGIADLLIVQFCCGERSSRTACEYTCGES